MGLRRRLSRCRKPAGLPPHLGELVADLRQKTQRERLNFLRNLPPGVPFDVVAPLVFESRAELARAFAALREGRNADTQGSEAG